MRPLLLPIIARANPSLVGSRHFSVEHSSSFTENRRLRHITSRLLHPRSTPLGTMTVAQWDEALQLMLHWFHDDDDEKRPTDQDDESSERSAIEHIHVTGSAVNSVDQLLHRLHHEHGTKTAAARLRTNELAQWTLAVLGAWIQIGRVFPASTMAAERSIEWWNKIMQWSQEGVWKGGLPLNEFTELVQVWLGLESPQGTEKAAELLLSDVIADCMAHDIHTIIPCYHQTLRQTIQFTESCGGLSASLIERMEVMALESGWEAIKPNEEEIQLQLDNLLLSRNTPENETLLSSFETQALQQRMLQLIKEAGEADNSTVNDIIERWSATEPDLDASEGLAVALLGYYLRIKDLRQATLWLFKVDQMDMAYDEKTKQFEQLVQLWSESDELDAAWRCSEILPRLEELVSQEGLSVNPSLYVSVARLWLKSGDSRSATKVLGILGKAKTIDMPLLQVRLDALLQGPTVSTESINLIITQFVDLWNKLDANELSILDESLARVIAKSNSAKAAMRFAQFMVQQGTIPSPAACELLLYALSAIPQPNDAATTKTHADPSGENATRIVMFLHKMVDIKVEFSDAKPFNMGMLFILQDETNLSSYRQVVGLCELMDNAGVPADASTLRRVLLACGRAHGKNDRMQALARTITTFYNIRLIEKVDHETYRLSFRAIEYLASRNDPLVEKLFLLCCHDGLVSASIRETLQNLVTPKHWNRLYTRHLLDDGGEPKEWSRNVPNSFY